jgi:hypothetical protein
MCCGNELTVHDQPLPGISHTSNDHRRIRSTSLKGATHSACHINVLLHEQSPQQSTVASDFARTDATLMTLSFQTRHLVRKCDGTARIKVPGNRISSQENWRQPGQRHQIPAFLVVLAAPNSRVRSAKCRLNRSLRMQNCEGLAT